ncbi:hypothetical protein ABBQ38_003717 [Trebouxia sp. C0009 RCD-2024]
MLPVQSQLLESRVALPHHSVYRQRFLASVRPSFTVDKTDQNRLHPCPSCFAKRIRQIGSQTRLLGQEYQQKGRQCRQNRRPQTRATRESLPANQAANEQIEAEALTPPLSKGKMEMEAQSTDNGAGSGQLEEMPGTYPHFALAILLLYGMNTGLSKFTHAANIQFPSALIGMFTIITGLVILDRASPQKAEVLVRWFDPAILWIQRWLGAFYVPSLAVLPLTIQGIAGTSLAKMFGVVAIGMPLTLLSTAHVAFLVRKYVKTEMLDTPTADALPPFGRMHFITWGVVATGAVGLASFNPGWAMYMTFPCLLAGTLEGTLIGSLLPPPANRILHPIIVTCLVINATAAVFGSATGVGYHHTLESYLTKGAGLYGAGDFLMSFLGVIILSFAFKIFDQRRLMVRHAPEILGACAVSSAVSMVGTAVLCRLAGLNPDLTLAMIPRSVTMALALPISHQLHASAGITALGVMLTGLLGANFAQILLNAGKFTDPIARGLSTSGAAHGLGTAAMAATEPEALPFCALAYALIGIISTLLIAVPGSVNVFMTIAGHA